MKFDEGIFGLYSRLYENRREVELSLEDYLGKCSDDPSYYAGAAERMLRAIGEPVMVDTSQEPLMGRRYNNRIIRVYPEFADFFGMEETIEQIVGFFRDAAQAAEERTLCLAGPFCGQQSELAERLKQLWAREPIYVLKAGNEISPVLESPLGLFEPTTRGIQQYRIPAPFLTGAASPWAVKWLDAYNGDPRKFTVVGLRACWQKTIGIDQAELGGGESHAASNLMGHVHIFLPHQGLTVAHANEADWQNHSHDRKLSDRISVVLVPKPPFCCADEWKAYSRLLRRAGIGSRARARAGWAS